MATLAEIKAELDAQGTGKKISILKHQPKSAAATTDTFYCLGGVDFKGRARWVNTTNTDTAAQQATAITNAMA